MFEDFLANYAVTSSVDNTHSYGGTAKLENALVETIKALGGKSFNNGIYRVCNFEKVEALTSLGEEYFPKLKGKIQVFGYDWLGRLFALDQTSGNRLDSEIVLIEPGAGDALEIPVNIVNFHNSILVGNAEEALAKSFFSEWSSVSQIKPGLSECIGYKLPLFLGGKDETINLEIADLEVYISICSQLWNKTRTLKPGQTIRSIRIEP